jgi:muramoyltetrapeptide carboxypeptidase
MIPPILKRDDKVAIVAPSRKTTLAEIEPAKQVMQGWGLNVVTGKTIGTNYFQFAGTDEERIEDFQAMLDDPTVKAIFCARGGYGLSRIIDDIDFRQFIKRPKWICGYSDVTVLHSHLTAVYGLSSLHCSMPVNFSSNSQESLDNIRKVLFGGKLIYHLQNNFERHMREGKVVAPVCGGNLSLLAHLIGTDSDVDTTGKILFLEDVDEYLYNVDRMMVQLKRAGKLENLAGLVVGHFSKMKNLDESNPFGKTAYEIIWEKAQDYDYPVFFGFPAGHEDDNRPFVIGGQTNFSVEKENAIFSL